MKLKIALDNQHYATKESPEGTYDAGLFRWPVRMAGLHNAALGDLRGEFAEVIDIKTMIAATKRRVWANEYL